MSILAIVGAVAAIWGVASVLLTVAWSITANHFKQASIYEGEES